MKNTEEYKVIGLMSGTSLDGLDITYCIFSLVNEKWCFELKNAKTLTYPDHLHEKLKNGIRLDGLELSKLDKTLGLWYGQQVATFITKHGLTVDMVASHGHTIFHQPEVGLTKQIGCGIEIMTRCNLPVVNDFRSLDVSYGGQGAPLVPVGDKLLFSEYELCLNLGGIANISFDNSNKRKAFDISPCNIILNHIANKLGLTYDNRGEIARSGEVNKNLLEALNDLDYYSAPYPKTLGYEWIEKNILARHSVKDNSEKDLLATYVEHISDQIAQSINNIENQKSNLLITGGGALNDFLIELIEKKISTEVKISRPDENTISYKEAIIFAFLGVLRWRKETNCLASVTGAKKDSCTGTIHHPIS